MSTSQKTGQDAHNRTTAILTEALAAFEQLKWLLDQLLEHDELPRPVYTVASIGTTVAQGAQDRVTAELDARIKEAAHG